MSLRAILPALVFALLVAAGCSAGDRLADQRPACDGTEELCNGVDDDCDGVVDESPAVECAPAAELR